MMRRGTMPLAAVARAWATLIAVGAGLALGLAATFGASVAWAQERERSRQGSWLIERDTVAIKPHAKVSVKKVSVDNRLGDITVVGTDGSDVALTVVKRAPDGEVLDRMKVNLVTDPDGTITIGTALLPGPEARPVPAQAIRIDISAEVPRGVAVDVKAWNGKVEVSGLRAGASLAAYAGEISVRDVSGKIVTTSAAGPQRLAGVRGDVSADSTSGNLSLDGVSGDRLAAKTHDAAVVATRVKSKQVQITTTFGTIHFSGEVLSTGQVELISYRGDVHVALVPAKGTAFTVDAYARDGKVDSKLELTESPSPDKGRLVGSYGSTRVRPGGLKVRSLLGDVHIGLIAE
jgi:hypothetical protein